jgi:hypothetical protein
MQMLATAGQSSQASMFNLRYDFPTEWSAIVNVPGNSFNVTTSSRTKDCSKRLPRITGAGDVK